MNSFIKITSANTGNPFIVAVNTIDAVVIDKDTGETRIDYKDKQKSHIKESIDEVWAMLKPSIIFC